MGISYIRMRLRPGPPREQVAALTEEQARAFHALDYGAPYSPLFPLAERDAQYTAAWADRYSEASNALTECLDEVRHEDAAPDFPNSVRVYPVTYCIALPPEWRRRAFRTILPDELPAQCSEWRGYVDDSLAGRNRDYLTALHLHQVSVAVFERWHNLIQTATHAAERAKLWAMLPGFPALREEMASLPEPVLHPVPVWSVWQAGAASPSPPAVTEAASAALQCLDTWMMRLSHEWDGRVRGWKIGLDRPVAIPLDDWLDARLNEKLPSFLAWVERCCQEGEGLSLDY